MNNKIVFVNDSDNEIYTTSIQHGTAVIHGKLDSGSPISVFEINAIKKMTNYDMDKFVKDISESNASCAKFKSYSGEEIICCLCSIKNIRIGNYFFDEYYFALNPTRYINDNRKSIPKVLIGKDLLSCCKGYIQLDGSILLNAIKASNQKDKMFKAFSLDAMDSKNVIPYAVDEFYSIQ